MNFYDISSLTEHISTENFIEKESSEMEIWKSIYIYLIRKRILHYPTESQRKYQMNNICYIFWFTRKKIFQTNCSGRIQISVQFVNTLLKGAGRQDTAVCML